MSDGSKLRYIELFAGCGGMSLGLESAGFHMVLGNEVSPMAAETFAYNLIPGSRKAAPVKANSPSSWLPHFTFLDPPKVDEGSSDEKLFRNWHKHIRDGQGVSKRVDAVFRGSAPSNLVVGDAGRLVGALKSFKENHPIVFSRRFGNVDLIAGGPPCQSFSLAGRRDRDNPRNRLFEAFVEMVELVRPKVVLFENVLGITRPFPNEYDEDWHPWHEVCRAFREAGYLPIPSLVNAADFGVPQSRPRFIMIALAEDLANKLECSVLANAGILEALRRARECYLEPSHDRGLIFQVNPDFRDGIWPYPLFPKPVQTVNTCTVSVRCAIEDLLSVEHGQPFARGGYADSLNRLLKGALGNSSSKSPPNHGIRKHGPKTRARFRLMRKLAEAGFIAKSMRDVEKHRGKAIGLLVGKPLLIPVSEDEYVERKRAKHDEIGLLIEKLSSAKNVQKSLNPEKPAPAQLSIPDDSIHWASDRVLTIREMARIQSFPDWFEFRSKETTGGGARTYEVPQYTQVGNAVPPLLARAFGLSIHAVLRRLEPSE